MNEEDILWIPKVSMCDSYPNTHYYKNAYLGKGGFAKVYTINDFNEQKEIIATYACKIIKKTLLAEKKESSFLNNMVSRFFTEDLFDKNHLYQADKPWNQVGQPWKQNITHQSLKNYYDIKYRQDIDREITIAEKLQHENIIKMIAHTEDSHFIYIILELADKSVQNLLENKIEFDINDYFTQLMQGVHYLHSLDYPIIHSDLKTNNLLIKNDTIKIIDFGLSFMISKRQSAGDNFVAIDSANIDRRRICYRNSRGELIYHITWGTFQYLAPEILLCAVKEPEKIDIWACGVILYVMLYKSYPGQFKTSNLVNDNNLLTYLELLLKRNPAERPMAEYFLPKDF